MDRGGEKEVIDIHTGIKNTLTMLNHKLKTGNIRVVEEFDLTLPHLKAMVGELNQVWTNLIDNAIDALENQPDPELRIITQRDKEFIKVSICDNGPGIPKEVRSKFSILYYQSDRKGNGAGAGCGYAHCKAASWLGYIAHRKRKNRIFGLFSH
ncbi:HAMP domain-containing sensor histidine kinase [Paucibacter sp. O1-1]|nr:HAMP domain-containing histidine kinase [Paucibacter sp. O1-1]MDA3829948.1 HAMP domain-containing sensor histidine kinase [Paucibacter sp. O1-1]